LTPVIGASGGLSGLLAFYIVVFPNASFAVYLLFQDWRIKAWFFFILWMALQFLMLRKLLIGTGHIAALAHIGGALAGIAAGFVFRKLASYD
jgi:membrane associated rhomboid family serine protease